VAEQVPAPAQVLCRIRGGRGAQAADRENRGPSKARIPNPWSPYLREQRNVQAGWLLISFRPTPHASQGDKNGLDLSAEAKKGVEGLIAELEAINPTPNPARVDLGGTKWELVYSSTAGASGGKLGPFIGQVTQVFPAGEGEIYFNIVRRPSSHPRQPSLRARPASALSTPVALAGGVGATQGGPESGIQL